MDIHATPDAWARLGRALELRRGRLGYGHGDRSRFVRATGGRLSAKTIARLERGERPYYPAVTLAKAEEMYRLAPGSIERFLAGGRLRAAAGGTVTGLTPDEERTVRAFVEVLRNRAAEDGEQRGA